jgi:hypothetical protein
MIAHGIALSSQVWATGTTQLASSKAPARKLMKFGATGARANSLQRRCGHRLWSISLPEGVDI